MVLATTCLGFTIAWPAVRPASAAAASPSASPSVILFVDGEPVQPLRLTYTIQGAATDLQFSLNEASLSVISGVSACTVNSATTMAVFSAGDVTVPLGTAGSAAGAVVVCDVSVALYASAQLTLTAGEVTGTNIVTAAALVTAQLATTSFTPQPLRTNGVVGGAFDPHRVGDVLSYTVVAGVDASAGATGVAGSGLTGNTTSCSTVAVGAGPSATQQVTCDVSRTLSQADLVAGTVDLGVSIAQVAGGTLARFERSQPVFATHLVLVELTAPDNIAVGHVAQLTVTAFNQGSSVLSGVWLGGIPTAELATAACSRFPESSQTVTAASLPAVLKPGERLSCTVGHRAVLDDVRNDRYVTVRGMSFGTDSDTIDDDPTDPHDIDAVSPSAFRALDPGVSLGSITQAAPIAIPVAITSATTTATVDVNAALELSSPRLRLTLPSGVSVNGCVAVAASAFCDLPLATGLPPSAVPFVVTQAAANAGLNLTVPATLVADGGIELALEGLALRTHGVAVSVVPVSSGFDAGTADSADFALTITTQPGASQQISLVGLPAQTSIIRCAVGATTFVPLAITGGFNLGVVDQPSLIVCTARVPIIGTTDRGDVSVAVRVVDRLGSAETTAEAAAKANAVALSIVVDTLPPSPPHGYSATGANDRPATFSIPVTVRATGTAAITGIVSPGLTCPATELRPEHDHPAEMICTHAHTVTADEIAADGVTLRFTTTGSAFEALPVRALTSFSFELAHESLVVKVIELSSPSSSSGYVPGEVVRLLVSVTNDGTLPIDVNSVVLPGSSANRAFGANRAFSAVTGSRISQCGQSVRLEPLASFDCGVDYPVVVADGIARTIELPFLVTTSNGLETNLTVTVRASTVGLQLPATGSDPQRLLLFGAALVVVGTLTRRFGQRSVDGPGPAG
jgi:hypothetical protein